MKNKKADKPLFDGVRFFNKNILTYQRSRGARPPHRKILGFRELLL